MTPRVEGEERGLGGDGKLCSAKGCNMGLCVLETVDATGCASDLLPEDCNNGGEQLPGDAPSPDSERTAEAKPSAVGGLLICPSEERGAREEQVFGGS